MKTFRIRLPFALCFVFYFSAFAADLLDFVWSGGISDTSVVVVAKTKDHSGNHSCKLAIYSDAGFTTEVFRSPTPTAADSNGNWVVKMTADSGLTANTTYYYRIEVDGTEDDTKTGRFKTAPPASGGNFKITFGNSNNLLNSQVYGWMQQYDPLFFIDTGDFHYLDINDADEAVALARHQAAYENNLNTNGTALRQAEFYRNVAFGYMWDDHDFGPDNSHAKGSISSRRATPETQSAVHSAYRQYMPHWPINMESNPSFPEGKAPIAQAFTIGRVRFILSDIRSQSEQNGSTATNATLMGEEQKAWFKEELLKASGTYPLIVWLSTTPWNGAQEPVAGNKWFEHTGERAEISNFLKDNHIRGFSAIGGDAHMAAIDDGSNTDFSTDGGAGFPIIHAAPIGTKNSHKGGPYSEGASALADYQYGSMEFEDRTNALVSSWFCLNGPSSVTDVIIATTNNIGNPLKYVFTNSWPLIASLSPVNDSVEIEGSTNLTITFNETIQMGSGDLRIQRVSDDVVEQTIAVTSTAVTVAGTQMTINPPADLGDDTAYYITLDEGAVTDGTADFPGIYAADGIDYKKWTFTTRRIDAHYALPFSEDFEALTAGGLAGQHGWTGSGTVQTSTVYAGSQAAQLVGQTLTHLFDNSPEQANISFYAKPTAGDAAPAAIPIDATAIFYVNTNNQLVAYSNQTPVELATSVFSNDWNFFEISNDYTNDTWSLSVNGTNAVQNFPFYNASTGFVGIAIFEDSGTTSYVDNVSISTGGDSDSDGLPDEWETLHYGNLSPNPGDPSSNGVNSVWETYVAGLNPTNPTSFFLLSASNPLQWAAVDGRTYTVWWTSNLLSGFNETLVSNYTGGAFTDLLHGTENKGFYKLDIKLSNP